MELSDHSIASSNNPRQILKGVLPAMPENNLSQFITLLMEFLGSDSPASSGGMNNEEMKENNAANPNEPSNHLRDDSQKETNPSGPAKPEKKPFKFKVTVFMICLTSVIVSMDSSSLLQRCQPSLLH